MQAKSLIVQLRDATRADSTFVFDVFREAFRPYAELGHVWDEAQEVQRHHDRMARQRVRIIDADAMDVGYMSTAIYEVTERYPAGLYLHHLMILPAHQSHGIGAECFQTVAGEARQLGLPLRFRVLRVNPRALAFYRRLGCAVVGEDDSHFTLEL